MKHRCVYQMSVDTAYIKSREYPGSHLAKAENMALFKLPTLTIALHLNACKISQILTRSVVLQTGTSRSGDFRTPKKHGFCVITPTSSQPRSQPNEDSSSNVGTPATPSQTLTRPIDTHAGLCNVVLTLPSLENGMMCTNCVLRD